jgi:hypothetical protein
MFPVIRMETKPVGIMKKHIISNVIKVMLNKTPYNTGLAKVAVHCSADTFVVKIATFAKPENVLFF